MKSISNKINEQLTINLKDSLLNISCNEKNIIIRSIIANSISQPIINKIKILLLQQINL
jgi:hypothetical protein